MIKKQKQIDIGSVWKLADGGNFYYEVLEHLDNGDVKVQGFSIRDGKRVDREQWTIDYFKLQYRYVLCD